MLGRGFKSISEKLGVFLSSNSPKTKILTTLHIDFQLFTAHFSWEMPMLQHFHV